MKSRITVVAFLIVIGSAAVAEARPFRPTNIPGGTVNSCSNCHVFPGGPRNDFGMRIEFNYLDLAGANDIKSQATVEWGPALAGEDADNDGYTNGEELGDPDGMWSIGDDNPAGTPTLPGDPLSFPCGDGTLQGPEICDDGDDNSDTDADACRTDCTEPRCGDGATDTGEECDDGNDNSDIDADACRTDCRFPTCGDGVVDGGEECDGPTGSTCEDIGAGSGFAPCNEATCSWDTDGCEEIPSGADAGTDTGEERATPGDDGCSAASAGGAPGAGLWLLAAAGMLLRRRRRPAPH